MRKLQISLLSVICLSQLAYAQSSAIANREFSSDDDFVKTNAVRLPKPVLAALLATKEAEAGRDWVRNNPGEDSNVLFNAFPVNLSTTAAEKDYVVVGKDRLTGADNVWFWIVRSISPKPQVLLFCSTLTVDVLSSAHNSLKDLRCAWESPGGDGEIEDYHFNGRRYVLAKRILTHRRP